MSNLHRISPAPADGWAIAGAVVIAFAWGHSTDSSTISPASAALASLQAAADLQTPASTAPETFDASPADSSEAAADDSDDDQSASSDDADASGTSDATWDDHSYVSSDGDCVHRPVAAATAPRDLHNGIQAWERTS